MSIDLVREINDLRRSPADYVDKLKRSKEYFKPGTNIWKHPDNESGLKTEEGPAAYDEAINFLKNKAQPVGDLKASKGLNKIAEEFLEIYQKDANANVEIEPIVEKQGMFFGKFRRFVNFGSFTAEQVIINLLASDGDKKRSHRNNILDPNLTTVGVAYGKHDTFKSIAVIVACNKFVNTHDKDDSAE